MNQSPDPPPGPRGTTEEQLTALGITPKPCPPWCTGDHFGPDPVLFAEDGFHHNGPTTVVTDSASTLYEDPADSELKLELTSWTPALATTPGPTHLRLSDGGDSVFYFTPDGARRLAAELTQLADQADAR
ncbi:hypothetical protein BZB76_0077 [Actinomadura pelletieri DSM 43383]|uniref:Uncharacterized protein n=2 Tax=Actinomadura pelletieri TaxID=111805 RepID=A0A495QX56_9ACTN|nr:hypothetical protein BZB76_0077 [Actinomadura pelletieri DSM 43383]